MFIKTLIILLIVLSFSGCSTKENDSFVKSMFQTNGAAIVRGHTYVLRDSLLLYKDKLDKRNPNHHSKENSKKIIQEITNTTNTITLELLKDKKDATYKDYLNIAFSSESVKDRNDYLILGMYKMLYWAYTKDRGHNITTFQYDIQKIKEANKLMQIIQYKVKTQKDKNGNLLFISWQRAWQVDMLKKLNKKQNISIDSYKNSELLKHSNMNFEILTSRMIFSIQESLRYLGEEGVNLSAQAVKSVFLFL